MRNVQESVVQVSGSQELGVIVLVFVGFLAFVKTVSLVLDYRAFRKARARREAVERELTLMGAAMGRKEIR